MHGLLAIQSRERLRAKPAGPERSGGRRARLSCLARNGGSPSGASRAGAPTGEESRAQPLRGSAASGTLASLKAGRGRRRGRTRHGRALTRPWDRTRVHDQKACHVLRRKLHTQGGRESLGAETAQVGVEVV